MTVIVTGAGGFIGNALLAHLTDLGAQCVAVSRNPSSKRIAGVDYRHIDLKDAPELRSIAQSGDVVVHLAATIYSDRDADLFLDNTFATYVLGDELRRSGKRLIFASTTAVYGGPDDVGTMTETSAVRPRTAYAMSKYLAEQAIAGAMVDAIVLRLTYVSGSGDTKSRLARLIADIARERPVRLVDEYRDVVDVDDVVKAISSALEYSGPSKLFNIGTGRLLSLRDASHIAMGILGRQVPVEMVGARPGFVVDAQRAKSEFGWTPERQPADIISGLCAQFGE